MDDKQPENLFKFDVYDIFGYLVPGAIFVIGVYVHANMFKMENLLNKLKEIFSYVNPFSDPWPEFLTVMTLFLFFAYLIGHLVASFSAAIMDKWVVERIFRFPHERLFKNLYKDKLQLSETSIPSSCFGKIKNWIFSDSPSNYNCRKCYFYKLMMTIFLMLLIYFAVRGTFDGKVLFLLISLTALIILKLIFAELNLPDIQAPDEERSADDKRSILANWLWRWIIQWWLKPLVALFFDSWSKSLLTLFRMRKPFTYEFQDKFIQQFKNTFDVEEPERIGTEIFWLTYAYVCQNYPASAKLIQRWLCLYGFARNLAVSFFLLFVYGVVMDKFCPAEKYQAEKYEYLSWCLITGIPAVVFGLRYYYIYYNYFSKYVFRAFVSAVQNNRDRHS